MVINPHKNPQNNFYMMASSKSSEYRKNNNTKLINTLARSENYIFSIWLYY